jgi:HK97 family phage major capsid protein
MAKTTTDNGTIPVPETPEELAEFIADDKRREQVFSDAEATKDFLAAYNKIVNKADNISDQVSEQVAAQMRDLLEEWGAEANRPDLSELSDEIVGKLGPQLNRAPKPATYNPRALGASIDDMFESSADYFKTIWHQTQPSPEVNAQLTRLRNAFSENVPSEGGFLVPERLRAELLRVALESSIVRPRARTVPMDSLRVPFPALDATSNASSVFGGIIAYWTEEAAALTATEAAFSQVVLEAKKLTAYTQVSNELVADSAISFQAFIDEIFPEALAFYEDYAFLQGIGVGEPLGVLHADNAASISVAKQAGQAADTIVWENIVNMYARMLPSSLGRAIWLASIDTFPELATMALSVGTGGSAIWLNNGAQGPPMTILGRPVIFTEKAPVVGDAGDLNFIDFGFYLIGDRQAMSARSSEHFRFQNDQTAYRIIERVDGRPWLPSAITPKNSGSTLSPYVKIAARA